MLTHSPRFKTFVGAGVLKLNSTTDEMTNGTQGQPAIVTNLKVPAPVVLVCEHAVNFIPNEFDGLGLTEDVRRSHVAWDPGAIEVARHLSQILNAPLVHSGVSRLVYDCNRPPTAPDAMPAKSEIFDVPGNQNLTADDHEARTQRYYEPFRKALARTVKDAGTPVLVTIHSFTPTYMGRDRATDIGVLHDTDARLADALLASAAAHSDMLVERNQPYGPQHGVTHTLKEHAVGTGLLNVMFELRNDHLTTSSDQVAMAEMLARWLKDALITLETQSQQEASCQE